MADKYPSAEVIGTDLSPIQPQWVPPNCSFQVDDAEMDFTFSPDSFDFVHVRNLAQGISDWDRFLGQIFTIIKPGAYVEIGELGFVAYSDDDTMPDDHGVKVFIELLSKAVTSIGRPPVDSRVLSGHLIKAGFEDVVAYDIKEPYGPWAKDRKLKQVGAMVRFNFL